MVGTHAVHFSLNSQPKRANNNGIRYKTSPDSLIHTTKTWNIILFDLIYYQVNIFNFFLIIKYRETTLKKNCKDMKLTF